MSTSNRIFKKGECLFKEGDKAQNIYLLQSGAVQLHLNRSKQKIDLMILKTGMIAGDHGLGGAGVHPYTATAATETKAVELPVDAVKQTIEKAPDLLKLLVKGLAEDSKLSMKELLSSRSNQDNTPCPQDQTAKIFATVYHVARTKGVADKSGAVCVPWLSMKQYAQRLFLESPARLENAINVLVKLGWAKYVSGKNEETGEVEIQFVTFTDLDMVEQFFEFFQYFYFKGGKIELLKVDERCMQIAETLIELVTEPSAAAVPAQGTAAGAIPVTVDRQGVATLDYTKVVEKMKEACALQLNNDHFTLLETKGLFVKRISREQSIVLQLDRNELVRTVKCWRVLREIAKWNEKGSVDLTEPIVDSRKAAASAKNECPACHHAIQGAPKFCAECGHKLAAAA